MGIVSTLIGAAKCMGLSRDKHSAVLSQSDSELKEREVMEMAKAVLISIRPEWVEKIARGGKTVEVRKTRPKLDTPFKCYIYCTQGNDARRLRGSWGKVIGEFICDRVETIKAATEPYGIYDVDDDFVAQTRLVDGALWDYGKGATLYGWHISKLEIYDTPKKLSKFFARLKSA